MCPSLTNRMTELGYIATCYDVLTLYDNVRIWMMIGQSQTFSVASLQPKHGSMIFLIRHLLLVSQFTIHHQYNRQVYSLSADISSCLCVCSVFVLQIFHLFKMWSIHSCHMSQTMIFFELFNNKFDIFTSRMWLSIWSVGWSVRQSTKRQIIFGLDEVNMAAWDLGNSVNNKNSRWFQPKMWKSNTLDNHMWNF